MIDTKNHAPGASLLRVVALAAVVWSYAAVWIAAAGELLFGPSGFWDVLPFQTLVVPIVVFFGLASNLWTPMSQDLPAPATSLV